MQQRKTPSLDAEARITLLDLHSRGFNQTQCAEALNTSVRTIRRASRELGIEWHTESGGEGGSKAVLDRIRVKRAALMEKLLDDAEDMRLQLTEDYEDSAFVGGQVPTHLKAMLEEPKAQDKAHLVRSIAAILQRTDTVLADPADATDTAASVLGQLAKALEARHAESQLNGLLTSAEDKIEASASDVAASAEDADYELLPDVSAKKTRFCDLSFGDCPNKTVPHLRAAGPCISEPLAA